MNLSPAFVDELVALIAERLAPAIAAELAARLPQTDEQREPWRLLDLEEAAARLGRSTRWIRERVKRGELPFVKLDGGALAFLVEDLEAFARARRVATDEPQVLAHRLHPIREAAPLGHLDAADQVGNRAVRRA